MMFSLGDLSAPDVATLIQSTADTYGVPSSIALAVAQRESGLNQNARGTKGEIGVFQLMPATAAGLGVNPADLTQNVDGGVRYLSQLYSQFGDWGLALQAYNGGPGNVQRGTVSNAAQGYAAAILAASGESDGVSVPDTLGTSGGGLPAQPATDSTGIDTPVLLAAAAIAAVALLR